MSENNKYNARISQLREFMKREKIDVYYIPTDDFHSSEYPSEYFKCREYMSGFTGSQGILIVTSNEAVLYTDGRYFIQAEEQLKGSGIELYKMGEQGVPTVYEYLLSHVKKGMCFGFDGRCLNANMVLRFANVLNILQNNITIRDDVDLVDEIWKDRPSLPQSEAFLLEDQYSGENVLSKIVNVRNQMKMHNTEVFVLTSLDDIAWLLNIRADDVEYNPVLLGFVIITMDKIILYCNEKTIISIKSYLESNNILIRPYSEIYHDLEELCINKDVMADLDKVNYRLYRIIEKKLSTDIKIVDVVNPTTILKAKKNEIEVKNEEKAHVKDAIAYIKFLYWFKSNIGKIDMTEISVAKKLLEFRQQQKNFIEESFESIVAYGKHGAIVHYSATKESNTNIEANSFVLIDTGAHYLEGTTDITRTLACGKLSNEQKRYYTAVLQGNLNLGDLVFKYGCRGINLDIVAREPLWKLSVDFNHGTGHGVGYLLNVHEGPNNIRYRMSFGKNESCIMEEGMITSNEPGLYLKNQYGIRLENLIVCKKHSNNEYGQFMKFETLTQVPFDLDAIDVKMLSYHEIELINNYHNRIYQNISPYLNNDEKIFLNKITRPIIK